MGLRAATPFKLHSPGTFPVASGAWLLVFGSSHAYTSPSEILPPGIHGGSQAQISSTRGPCHHLSVFATSPPPDLRESPFSPTERHSFASTPSISSFFLLPIGVRRASPPAP
ncbi:hypothetical protein Cadr_000023212 [Camelus dromedarius]|uniref:Uncharacterized protein n=1 Tax=Camelus dromedarius TaxID=9838 RepID=A0A5N4CI92_CAMDR|nr:hypothetical protein Cadr_000023212 [Camelus dromedarius]